MSYQFIVTYGEGWKCISVEFPGASPKIPEAEPLPEGELIKIVSLGQTVITYESSHYHLYHGPGCYRRRVDIHLQDPSAGKKLAITFNGDGGVVSFSDQKMETTAEKLIPLASAGLKKIKKIKPLGELLIFKLPDGKFIHCVHNYGLIVTSPVTGE
jgi:hypothetical protein